MDSWTFHRCKVLLQEQELCLPAAAADMSHSAVWLCVAVSSTCELHSSGKVLRSAPSQMGSDALSPPLNHPRSVPLLLMNMLP